MEPELEKAKIALNKYLCFTELQVNEAKKEEKELMSKDDIEYVLSLNGIKKKDVCQFKSSFKTYNSYNLINAIFDAKNKGFQGLRLMTTLRTEDTEKIKSMGYFVKMDSDWDEVYFTEEAYILNEISNFKNLFAGLSEMAASNVI